MFVPVGHNPFSEQITQAVDKHIEMQSDSSQKTVLEPAPKVLRLSSSSSALSSVPSSPKKSVVESPTKASETSSGLSSPPSSAEKKGYAPLSPAKSPTPSKSIANTNILEDQDVLITAAETGLLGGTASFSADKQPVQASANTDSEKEAENEKSKSKSRKKREKEKRQKAKREASAECESRPPGLPQADELGNTHEPDTPSGPYTEETFETWLKAVNTLMGYPKYCGVLSTIVSWKEGR
jgi:hypothetical protein